MIGNRRGPKHMSLVGKLLGILPVLAVVMLLVATFGNAGTASAGEPYTRALTTTLTDGTVVTVEASTDAIPEGTTLEAKAIDNDAITEAVTAAAKADGTELTSVKAIDITLRDAAGNELEPSAAVKVTLSELGMNETGLSVYHVTAPDGNEAQATNAEDLNVEKVESSTTDANEQVFEAKSFSIYVVGQSKRLEVRFHNLDGAVNKTIYVSENDFKNNNVANVVYDPGCTVTGQQAFKGWTTNTNWTVDSAGMSIDEVRSDITNNHATFNNGVVIDYYPIVVTTHRVVYVSEYGAAVHTDEVRVKGGDTATYTVNYAHVPDKHEARFEGWSETKGSTTAGAKNGETTYTFDDNTADKTLYAVVVDGAWFTFDAQADDASYTPPVFVQYGKSVSEVQEIAKPTRPGHTFAGWCKDKLGNEPYNFDTKVDNTTGATTLYAKWTPNATATYTINYWRQSVTDAKDATDKTYDFAESRTATASRGEYVTGPDDRSYDGFHFGSSTEAYVNPNGSTVVNVYYDRDLMTINFKGNITERIWHGGTRSTKTGTWWGGTYTYEVLTINGTDYEIKKTWRRTEYITVGSNDYDIEKNDSSEWGYYTTETKRSNTYYTGLYGQTLAQNGYTWPGDNNSWRSSDSDYYYNTLTFLDAFLFDGLSSAYSIDKSQTGKQTLTLYGAAVAGSTHVRHYKEDLNGNYALANDTTMTGGDFNITNKYNGFEAYQYSTNGGSSWQTATAGTTTVPQGYSSLQIHYTRNKYALTFFDGAYVTPGGETTLSSSDASLLTSGNTILYEARLDEAKDANGKFYKDYRPADKDGYIFAGWYKDKACTVPFNFNTTMPLDGTKAYAKWTKLQYDVVLHDGSANGNEYIGDYETPIDVDYNDGVAEPTANRGNEWVLVGWYTDANFTQPYTFGYKLNSAVETTLGIDTNVHTDKNDMTQDYIKGQLNLYAKWRHVLVGADGITLVYDAGEGNTVNGAQTYTDTNNVYQDGATGAATSAAKYKNETQKFQYWVVQKWDSAQNKYVDTDVKVFPGNTFTVNYADARQMANEDNTEDNPSYTYTVQLRAVYADATPETTTVIFDANGGAGNAYVANAATNTNQNTKSYEVNTKIDIPTDPTREGYDFLGWSGTKKDVWTQDEWDAATAFTADVKTIDSGKSYKLVDGVTYYADNLSGFAKTGDKTNTVYACWKKKPVTLTIQKEITGAQADLTKGYTFTVTKADGTTYTTTALYDRHGTNGTGGSITLGGEGKTGLELLWGDKVTVAETDNTGYTTTYTTTVGDGAANNGDGTSTGELTLNGNGKVVFTNEKTPVPVTAVLTHDAPKVLGVLAIAGLAIAGGFALVQRNTLQAASAGAHSAGRHATKRTDSNGNGRHMRGNGRRW